MTDREVINPHDKIFIDCEDMDAAQWAVLTVGKGAYGIEGDDGLPLLLFGGLEEWCQEAHDQSFSDWYDSVTPERAVKALRSMRLDGERSNMSNPVKSAHDLADMIELEKGLKKEL